MFGLKETIFYLVDYLSKEQNKANSALDLIVAVIKRHQKNTNDPARDTTHAARRILGTVSWAMSSRETFGSMMCAYLLLGNEIAHFSHDFAPLLVAQFLAYFKNEPIEHTLETQEDEHDRIVPTSQVSRQTEKRERARDVH
jgi:hypothetical protein